MLAMPASSFIVIGLRALEGIVRVGKAGAVAKVRLLGRRLTDGIQYASFVYPRTDGQRCLVSETPRLPSEVPTVTKWLIITAHSSLARILLFTG